MMIRDFHTKSRKQRAMIASILCLCYIALILQTDPGYSDWKDWAVIGAGVVGVGVTFAGLAITSPAITVVGGTVAAVAIGITIWDQFDDSDEDETCSRCNVTYARGTDHYCIYDHIDEEHGGDESSEGSYGYSTGGYGYCPNGHYYSGVHSCYSSD